MSERQPTHDAMPRRFIEGGRGDPLDARIGACLRHVVDLPALPNARVEAIGRRLFDRVAAKRRSPWQYAAVAFVLLCVGTAAAVVRLKDRELLHGWASQVHAPARPEASDASTSSVVTSSPEQAPVWREPPAAGLPPAAKEQPPARPPRSKPPAASEPAMEGSTLGAEARLLRRAIESLRTEANPAQTLAILDEHRANFPDGRLRANADLLRVDALLALGRRADALAWLESADLDRVPRGDELLVTRGELRADTDCANAVRDFDRALAGPLPDKLAERALRGRAVCRLRAGDRTHAEPDLREYLRRFPNGTFAPRAREWLKAL